MIITKSFKPRIVIYGLIPGILDHFLFAVPELSNMNSLPPIPGKYTCFFTFRLWQTYPMWKRIFQLYFEKRLLAHFEVAQQSPIPDDYPSMTSKRCLFLALLLIQVAGECENACSGHGQCTAFDMCLCFRNWQGNDCSERKYKLIPCK